MRACLLLQDAVCDYLPCLRAVEHALAVDQAAWEAWDRCVSDR